MTMDDKLLSDIFTTERSIRQQIDALEQQTAERLLALKQELDRMLESESVALQAELELAQNRAEETARLEAEALQAEAGAFALRLKNIDSQELDTVVVRHLARILPEGGQ